MTLNELIQQLTDLREELAYGGDEYEAGEVEVIGATQPNYPLDCELQEITAIIDDEGIKRVYLAFDDAGEYGTRRAWDGGIIEIDDEDDDQ